MMMPCDPMLDSDGKVCDKDANSNSNGNNNSAKGSSGLKLEQVNRLFLYFLNEQCLEFESGLMFQQQQQHHHPLKQPLPSHLQVHHIHHIVNNNNQQQQDQNVISIERAQTPHDPSICSSGSNSNNGSPLMIINGAMPFSHYECAHCGSKETPMWRKLGSVRVCNACGLYYKQHGRKRECGGRRKRPVAVNGNGSPNFDHNLTHHHNPSHHHLHHHHQSRHHSQFSNNSCCYTGSTSTVTSTSNYGNSIGISVQSPSFASSAGSLPQKRKNSNDEKEADKVIKKEVQGNGQEGEDTLLNADDQIVFLPRKLRAGDYSYQHQLNQLHSQNLEHQIYNHQLHNQNHQLHNQLTTTTTTTTHNHQQHPQQHPQQHKYFTFNNGKPDFNHNNHINWQGGNGFGVAVAPLKNNEDSGLHASLTTYSNTSSISETPSVSFSVSEHSTMSFPFLDSRSGSSMLSFSTDNSNETHYSSSALLLDNLNRHHTTFF